MILCRDCSNIVATASIVRFSFFEQQKAWGSKMIHSIIPWYRQIFQHTYSSHNYYSYIFIHGGGKMSSEIKRLKVQDIISCQLIIIHTKTFYFSVYMCKGNMHSPMALITQYIVYIVGECYPHCPYNTLATGSIQPSVITTATSVENSY